MPWLRVDDAFPGHKKLVPLEDDARRWADAVALWLAGGCYCSANLTDGHIPAVRLARLTPMGGARATKAADDLVEVGLWRRVDDGYEVHDFLDFNPSKKQVEEERRQKTDRQRKWRETRDDARDAHVDASTSPLRDGAVDGAVEPVPSRPVPTRPVPTKDPSTVPWQEPNPPETSTAVVALRDTRAGLTRAEVEQRVGNGVAFAPKHLRKLTELQPILPHELEWALGAARSKDPRCGPGFVLAVLERGRREAAEQTTGAGPPMPLVATLPRKDRELAAVMQATETTGGHMFEEFKKNGAP